MGMKAIGATEFGGPDALRILDVPTPQAGTGGVRVKVSYAAVNPADAANRSGESRKLMQKFGVDVGPDPDFTVMGLEFSGTVDQIGDGVESDLSVGDKVIGLSGAPEGGLGAYAQYVVTSASSVVRAPRGIDDAAAATILMNGATARLILDKLDLPIGGTVLVTGAAGTLGGYVVQMARLRGLRVLADASDTDRARVAALGSDLVLRRGEDIVGQVLAAVPCGVDAVADTALLNDAITPAVRDHGAIATVQLYTGSETRGIRWEPVVYTDYLREHGYLQELSDLAADHALTLRVAGIYPPQHAAEAHRQLEAGGVRGRFVLDFEHANWD